jgi:hypothetical protein
LDIETRGICALRIRGGRGQALPPWFGFLACASFHAAQFTAWKGLHHDLAMQTPTKATVFGDFANATFTKNGHHDDALEAW